MAGTKKCPMCGGDILEAANKCKHCKQWLIPPEEISATIVQSSQGAIDQKLLQVFMADLQLEQDESIFFFQTSEERAPESSGLAGFLSKPNLHILVSNKRVLAVAKDKNGMIYKDIIEFCNLKQANLIKGIQTKALEFVVADPVQRVVKYSFTVNVKRDSLDAVVSYIENCKGGFDKDVSVVNSSNKSELDEKKKVETEQYKQSGEQQEAFVMEGTKKCPMCGGEILETANKCKHCKQWLVPHEEIPAETPSSQTTAQSSHDVGEKQYYKKFSSIINRLPESLVSPILGDLRVIGKYLDLPIDSEKIMIDQKLLQVFMADFQLDKDESIFFFQKVKVFAPESSGLSGFIKPSLHILVSNKRVLAVAKDKNGKIYKEMIDFCNLKQANLIKGIINRLEFLVADPVQRVVKYSFCEISKRDTLEAVVSYIENCKGGFDKKCPLCGGEILAKANKCKHCKQWLIPTVQSSPDMIDQELLQVFMYDLLLDQDESIFFFQKAKTLAPQSSGHAGFIMPYLHILVSNKRVLAIAKVKYGKIYKEMIDFCNLKLVNLIEGTLTNRLIFLVADPVQRVVMYDFTMAVKRDALEAVVSHIENCKGGFDKNVDIITSSNKEEMAEKRKVAMLSRIPAMFVAGEAVVVGAWLPDFEGCIIQNLGHGEKIVARCYSDDQVLVTTTDKVLLLKKGLSKAAASSFGFGSLQGVIAKSIDYYNVSSVDCTKGMIYGHVEFTFPGAKEVRTGNFFSNLESENVFQFPKEFYDHMVCVVNEIRRYIKIALQPQAVMVQSTSPAESIPDQIKKLAELKTMGILTEEEFQVKKKELLAKM